MNKTKLNQNKKDHNEQNKLNQNKKITMKKGKEDDQQYETKLDFQKVNRNRNRPLKAKPAQL